MLQVRTRNESAGPYHGFGTAWEQRISEAVVKKHFGGPLKMGWERDVRDITDELGFHQRLTVANISGMYFIRSASVPVADWPRVFGVQCLAEADDKPAAS